MSLSDNPIQENNPTETNQTITQPTPTPKPTTPTKKPQLPKGAILAKAKEAAKKYLDLPYAAAKDRIREECRCATSTAHKAYHLAMKEKNKPKAPIGDPAEQEAGLNIIESPDKAPAFLETREQLQPQQTETAQLSELTTQPTQPITQEMTDDQKEQLDLFRDMLRSLYVMAFSDEGIAGKYGRKPKQCEQLADQQYRWLLRRYSIDDLQRWDTIILAAAYGTVVGGIAKDFMAERAKKRGN